jgi:hypothetical protein
MKLRNYCAIGLVSFLVFGCGQDATTTQAPASPAAESSAASTPVSQPEATTAQATSTEKKVVKSGSFVSGEHPTQGIARIVDQGGKFAIELDSNFKTFDMGPDLVVVLHRSDDVIGNTNPPAYPLKEGDYVFIEELQKFSGAQTYAIPSNVKLDDYKSVAIWCRKFNATFGAAKLSS